MATIPTAGYFLEPARTQGELKTGFDDMIASLRHVPWAGQPELTATITSGVIIPAGSGGVVVVDTEGAASTDDLTSITTTNYPDGSFLLLRNASASRVVTVKHAVAGIGTIALDRGADYVLDDTKKWLLLRRHGNDWYELIRGPQRMTSEVYSKTGAFTVAKEDVGKTFVCSGTFTISLTAAASLGSGFLFGIRNDGTGVLTVDPNSSELLDGVSTLSIQVGWSYLFLCTGTAWVTVSAHGPRTSTGSMIVNGLMQVWQRGTTLAISISGGSGAYLPADRWLATGLGPTSFSATVNRSTNVPTVAQAGVLFNYSLEVDCTTVISPLTNDVMSIQTLIIQHEFTQYRRTNPFTVSFWVMSPKTGTHSVVFREIGYSCVLTYTVNAANTWEFKAVTFPTSVYTGSASFFTAQLWSLHWILAAGATYTTGSTGAWTTSTVYAGTGQVNVLDNTANFFRITGVKVDRGSVASPYAVSAFDTDFMRSQMWFAKSFTYATLHGDGVGVNSGEYIFPSPVGASTAFDSIYVPFRFPRFGGATIFLYNPAGGGTGGRIRNITRGQDCSATGWANSNPHGFQLTGTTSAGTVVGDTMGIHWIAIG